LVWIAKQGREKSRDLRMAMPTRCKVSSNPDFQLFRKSDADFELELGVWGRRIKELQVLPGCCTLSGGSSV